MPEPVPLSYQPTPPTPRTPVFRFLLYVAVAAAFGLIWGYGLCSPFNALASGTSSGSAAGLTEAGIMVASTLLVSLILRKWLTRMRTYAGFLFTVVFAPFFQAAIFTVISQCYVLCLGYPPYNGMSWRDSLNEMLISIGIYVIPFTIYSLPVSLPIAALQLWVLRRILGARKLVSPIVPN